MAEYTGVGTVGTGTTFSMTDGNFAAEILSLSHGGITREAIDVTSFASDAAGAKEFVPGELYDPGELTLELIFDPTAANVPPILTTPPTVNDVVVTFPNPGTNGVWTTSGFMTSFEYNDPMEDKMTATATIKFTGAIVETS